MSVSHTTIPRRPGPRLPNRDPGAPLRPGPQLGGRSVTTTVRRSHAHWKSESLACVVALQNAEADLKQAISVCEAFGDASQAEMITGALAQISAVRARVYDDRNNYGLTDAAKQVAAAPKPAVAPPGPQTAVPPANDGHGADQPGGASVAGLTPPSGQRLDCLKLIKPSDHTKAGTWTSSADGLTSSGRGFEVVAIPYSPAEEYDIAASFTRLTGDEDIAIVLRANGSKFMFVMGGWHNRVIGADMVGKLRADSAPNSIRGSDLIPIGRANKLEIKVRKGRLDATVDGKSYQISTDYAGSNSSSAPNVVSS